MIIEIALGIVLAVLILMNLDWILALGLILVVVVLALVAIGVVIYFATKDPAIAAIVAIAGAVILGAAYVDSKKKTKEPTSLVATAATPSDEAGEKHPEFKLTWAAIGRSGQLVTALYLLGIAGLLLYLLILKLPS